MSGYINSNIKSGVYKITCLANNRVYIGSSNNIHRRIIEHKSDLKLNKHHNRFLQKDYNKYGLSAFQFDVVCYCDVDKLLLKEQQIIDKYAGLNSSSNYNLFSTDLKHRSYMAKDNKGCNNPMYNKTHTNKTKQLISEHNSMNRKDIREKVSKTLRDKTYYDVDVLNEYRKLYLETGNIKYVARVFNKNSATMYYLIKYGCCNKQQHLKYPDIYPNWFNTLTKDELQNLKNKQKQIRQKISKKANLVKSKKFNNNSFKFLF